MTPFSQISMKFVEESSLTQENQPVPEDQPVNVGIRIKKLKSAESAILPEEAQEPLTVDVVEAEVVETVPEEQMDTIKSTDPVPI
jgi:hypothetical protein